MGSSPFYCEAEGKTIQEAFENARKAAYDELVREHEADFDELVRKGKLKESDKDEWGEYEYQGYTGTIYGKSEFVEIELPADKDPKQHALDIHLDDRVSDKWGPAGAFNLGNGRWAFWGRASS